METLSLSKDSKIILDTCILQYLNDDRIRPELIRVLVNLTKKGARLYFSDFSTYELFSGCNSQKKQKLLEIWNKFPRFSVWLTVTKLAAELSTIYQENVNHYDSISDGDKIIGAQAIISKSFVITSDANDFPRPFFNECTSENIQYQNKKRKILTLAIYVLEPNYKKIDAEINNIK
jgi:predicted nucleic acid-binding protein